MHGLRRATVVCRVYLNKVEDSEFADDYRGRHGPIKVRNFKPDQWTVDQAAFYEACRAAGYPDCPDHNRPDSSGVGPLVSNCFEGELCSKVPEPHLLHNSQKVLFGLIRTSLGQIKVDS